jgi:hypothetical protein
VSKQITVSPVRDGEGPRRTVEPLMNDDCHHYDKFSSYWVIKDNSGITRYLAIGSQ